MSGRPCRAVGLPRPLGLLCVLSLLALPPGASARRSNATAARSVSVSDEGKLRLIRSSGATLTDEGAATGTLPGRVRIQFVYNGNPSVQSQITIFGRSGSVSARASGRLSSPTSRTPSFSGTLTITGGTGSYRRARGGGHLYGVFNRRTYGLTVQTRGTLSY